MDQPGYKNTNSAYDVLILYASDSPRGSSRLKQFGTFTLDTLNECLWRAGARIALPPKPFAVLRYLVEHPGRLVSHDELLDALWPETYVQPQILRTYILDLRRVLEDDARNPRFIQSLPKRGYCFIASVSDGAAPAAAPSGEAPANVVGRDAEFDLLHAAMQQAAGGSRQIVFMNGESGIGKSALVEAFRACIESSQQAAAVLGQCVPGFAGKQEYYPLADAFRCWSESSQAKAICRILHNHAAGPAAADSEADPAASPVPGELCSALEDMARDKPLLLILEDLEWSDDSTLAVLSAMARRRGPAKLMIVATVAPRTGSRAEAITRLMHDLCLRRLCLQINLGRLPKSSVAHVIRARLGQPALPEGLHEFVHVQSEGNPRFVLAILEHLIAEKLLERVDTDHAPRWELRSRLDQDASTPGELARAIELEIEHLSAEEQQLLEAGSLATVAFPAWMVAAALGQDVASIEEACDALARRVSFVKRVGEDELPDGTRSSFYVFAHAMFREVLYQRQSAARRADRHARVAQRLRAIFYGRDELIANEAAAHYEAAGDWTNAIAMLRLAARRALEMQAGSEAADLHQHITRLSAYAARNGARSLPTDVCDELMWSHDSHDLDIAHNAPSTPAKA
jgi:DNA-binding winged helix-turn-helix (wHTH) protein